MPSMATGAKAMQTVSQRVISDAHLLDDALYEDESTEIATLLSSTVTSQKLDGLKRLIACISFDHNSLRRTMYVAGPHISGNG